MTTDAYPTEITPEDLMLIGHSLVMAACGMNALGHESPAGLADYVDPTAIEAWHGRFVLDMVAYSQGMVQDQRKNDALDRIHGFAWQTGMMHHAAEASAEEAGRIG
jgi:hypothetical protein